MNEANKLKSDWANADEAEINAAIGALLQHKGGRRLLWWLLQVGKVGTQPFANQALLTSFNCGQLDVGNRILDRITSVSPEGYVTMMKEQADEYRTRSTALDNAGTYKYDPSDDDD